MRCKVGLFLIGLIIVFLLISAARDSKGGEKQEHDTEPKQQRQHNEDPLKCPQSPVKAAVGEDVTLDFQFEPKLDVTLRTVEWKFNKSFVLLYRSQGFSENDEHEQFKGRASFDSSGNLSEGKLPLKISNVTTADVGFYSCSVRYKKDKIICSTELIIGNPEENRNKGNQIDSDKKQEENNNNNKDRHHFVIVPVFIIAVILLFVVIFIRRKHVKNNPHEGQGGGEPQEEREGVLRADNIQPDPHEGQDEGEPQEEHKLAAVDNIDPGQGGAEPQEESELSAIAGNIQPDLGAGQDRVEPQEERERTPRPGRWVEHKLPQRPGSVVRQRQVTTLAN